MKKQRFKVVYKIKKITFKLEENSTQNRNI